MFVRASQYQNALSPTEVIESGMITVCRELNELNSSASLLNAPSPTDVKVSGMVQEVPSSESKRRASALVKTVILEEERKEGKRVLVFNYEININRLMNSSIIFANMLICELRWMRGCCLRKVFIIGFSSLFSWPY